MTQYENIRVLLVEDDIGDADYLTDLLSDVCNQKFDVIHVQRLHTALEKLAHNDVDLILLDLGLPDSTGLNTIRNLRKQAAQNPVFILTGLDDEEVSVEAMAEGAQDYLVKNGLEQNLQQLANQDPLTSLPNRRHLMDLLDMAFNEAKLYGNPLTLCILDLDHFKLINDRFGHIAGDKVLEEVGKIMKSQLRKDDIASRYGGDEFFVVFPHAPKIAAEKYVGRVKKKIERLCFRNNGSRFYAGLTAGIARLGPYGLLFKASN